MPCAARPALRLLTRLGLTLRARRRGWTEEAADRLTAHMERRAASERTELDARVDGLELRVRRTRTDHSNTKIAVLLAPHAVGGTWRAAATCGGRRSRIGCTSL